MIIVYFLFYVEKYVCVCHRSKLKKNRKRQCKSEVQKYRLSIKNRHYGIKLTTTDICKIKKKEDSYAKV